MIASSIFDAGFMRIVGEAYDVALTVGGMGEEKNCRLVGVDINKSVFI